MIQTQENGENPQFGPNIGPLVPSSGRQFFFLFFKNLASLVIRYHGQLSSWAISEKKMILS